ncbi:MAG: IS1634 family transposase [Endomicrobia bacterium]|nr:IS1634 family transposase [Endomicrobiia bacterium]
MFLALAREQLKDKVQEEFRFREFEGEAESEIIHKKSYSKFLYDTIGEIYDKIGINEVKDEIFKQVTIARIIRPASKLETVEILERLGLEYPLEAAIYRSLKRALKNKYRERITEEYIKRRGLKKASLLLYDVTTLYFEIEKEDEYRKSGLSKERRLEPQIVVGLLIDEKEFPLGINSFEGNKAETKTMLPVLKEFGERCKVKELTVVADAAMMSGENLDLLEA